MVIQDRRLSCTNLLGMPNAGQNSMGHFVATIIPIALREWIMDPCVHISSRLKIFFRAKVEIGNQCEIDLGRCWNSFVRLQRFVILRGVT